MRRRNAGATSNRNSKYRRRVVLERKIRREVVTGSPSPADVFNALSIDFPLYVIYMQCRINLDRILIKPGPLQKTRRVPGWGGVIPIQVRRRSDTASYTLFVDA